jgi:hypothetical protein
MTPTDATARVQSLVQWDVDPVLTADEVAHLVSDARRIDSIGNRPANVDSAPPWVALTAHVANDVIQVGARWWRAVNAGTTGSTEPQWPDLGLYAATDAQLDDGTVTWVDNGGAWSGTYDLRSAACRGWELKASKCTGRFDFLTDNQNFKRSQQFTHCMAMADHYRRRMAGSIPISVA